MAGSDFVVGGLARDGDFQFRLDFIEDLWEMLKKQDVLLLAPRRMGKTSVMYHLLDHPQDDWLVVHTNVEAIQSPAQFFIELINALHEHDPHYLKHYLAKGWKRLNQVLGRVEEIDILDFKVALREDKDWSTHWKQYTEELIKRIQQSERKIFFIIDELPDMLSNIREHDPTQLEEFLHLFRSIRMAPQNTKIRWLIGGSVNIRGVLEEEGMINLINDLHVEILPPFTAAEIEKFVTQMLTQRNVEFDPAITARITELLGSPIPYFLQLFTQELYRHWKRTGQSKITTDDVDTVFDHALMGEAARDKLQHFYSRIKAYYHPSEYSIVHTILLELARSPEGISKSGLFTLYQQTHQQFNTATTAQHYLKNHFERLLWRLESDFYIQQKSTNSQYDFSSRLLKTWWQRTYSYGK